MNRSYKREKKKKKNYVNDIKSGSDQVLFGLQKIKYDVLRATS